MPHPIEVRRLGDRWHSLKAEVIDYAATIPAEGVTLPVFDMACLDGIRFDDRDVIVESLRRAKVIFKARQGAEWRIFGEANGKRLADPSADPLLAQFLAGAGWPMLRLTDLAALDQTRDERATERAVSNDVAGFVRRYVERGGELPKARGLLWKLFPAAAMAVLARYEPTLAEGSDVEELAPSPEPYRRPTYPADPLERLYKVISNAGREGINRSALYLTFPHPRPPQAQVTAWLDEIVAGGAAHTVKCKLNRMGRPGQRYFSAEIDAPYVVDGVLMLD